MLNDKTWFELKSAIIIQTRMGSTRYPGKVMKELTTKKKIIDYVISQLGHSKYVKDTIIATTILKEDDEIETYCKKNNIKCFRGEPLDVLDRYYKCAKKFGLDIVIRITSDAPFVDPELLDDLMKIFFEGKFDFVSNNIIRSYSIGFDVEIFSFKTLTHTWKYAKLPSEREHVTTYMKKNHKAFKLYNLKNPEKIPIYKFTIDRKEDLKLLQEIAENIKDRPILMKHIINLLNNNEKILKMCKDETKISEGYEKSLKEDETFLEQLNNNERSKISKSFKEIPLDKE